MDTINTKEHLLDPFLTVGLKKDRTKTQLYRDIHYSYISLFFHESIIASSSFSHLASMSNKTIQFHSLVLMNKALCTKHNKANVAFSILSDKNNTLRVLDRMLSNTSVQTSLYCIKKFDMQDNTMEMSGLKIQFTSHFKLGLYLLENDDNEIIRQTQIQFNYDELYRGAVKTQYLDLTTEDGEEGEKAKTAGKWAIKGKAFDWNEWSKIEKTTSFNMPIHIGNAYSISVTNNKTQCISSEFHNHCFSFLNPNSLKTEGDGQYLLSFSIRNDGESNSESGGKSDCKDNILTDLKDKEKDSCFFCKDEHYGTYNYLKIAYGLVGILWLFTSHVVAKYSREATIKTNETTQRLIRSSVLDLKQSLQINGVASLVETAVSYSLIYNFFKIENDQNCDTGFIPQTWIITTTVITSVAHILNSYFIYKLGSLLEREKFISEEFSNISFNEPEKIIQIRSFISAFQKNDVKELEGILKMIDYNMHSNAVDANRILSTPFKYVKEQDKICGSIGKICGSRKTETTVDCLYRTACALPRPILSLFSYYIPKSKGNVATEVYSISDNNKEAFDNTAQLIKNFQTRIGKHPKTKRQYLEERYFKDFSEFQNDSFHSKKIFIIFRENLRNLISSPESTKEHMSKELSKYIKTSLQKDFDNYLKPRLLKPFTLEEILNYNEALTQEVILTFFLIKRKEIEIDLESYSLLCSLPKLQKPKKSSCCYSSCCDPLCCYASCCCSPPEPQERYKNLALISNTLHIPVAFDDLKSLIEKTAFIAKLSAGIFIAYNGIEGILSFFEAILDKTPKVSAIMGQIITSSIANFVHFPQQQDEFLHGITIKENTIRENNEKNIQAAQSYSYGEYTEYTEYNKIDGHAGAAMDQSANSDPNPNPNPNTNPTIIENTITKNTQKINKNTKQTDGMSYGSVTYNLEAIVQKMQEKMQECHYENSNYLPIHVETKILNKHSITPRLALFINHSTIQQYLGILAIETESGKKHAVLIDATKNNSQNNDSQNKPKLQIEILDPLSPQYALNTEITQISQNLKTTTIITNNIDNITIINANKQDQNYSTCADICLITLAEKIQNFITQSPITTAAKAIQIAQNAAPPQSIYIHNIPDSSNIGTYGVAANMQINKIANTANTITALPVRKETQFILPKFLNNIWKKNNEHQQIPILTEAKIVFRHEELLQNTQNNELLFKQNQLYQGKMMVQENEVKIHLHHKKLIKIQKQNFKLTQLTKEQTTIINDDDQGNFVDLYQENKKIEYPLGKGIYYIHNLCKYGSLELKMADIIITILKIKDKANTENTKNAINIANTNTEDPAKEDHANLTYLTLNLAQDLAHLYSIVKESPHFTIATIGFDIINSIYHQDYYNSALSIVSIIGFTAIGYSASLNPYSAMLYHMLLFGYTVYNTVEKVSKYVIENSDDTSTTKIHNEKTQHTHHNHTNHTKYFATDFPAQENNIHLFVDNSTLLYFDTDIDFDVDFNTNINE